MDMVVPALLWSAVPEGKQLGHIIPKWKDSDKWAARMPRITRA